MEILKKKSGQNQNNPIEEFNDIEEKTSKQQENNI